MATNDLVKRSSWIEVNVKTINLVESSKLSICWERIACSYISADIYRIANKQLRILNCPKQLENTVLLRRDDN